MRADGTAPEKRVRGITGGKRHSGVEGDTGWRRIRHLLLYVQLFTEEKPQHREGV